MESQVQRRDPETDRGGQVDATTPWRKAAIEEQDERTDGDVQAGKCVDAIGAADDDTLVERGHPPTDNWVAKDGVHLEPGAARGNEQIPDKPDRVDQEEARKER